VGILGRFLNNPLAQTLYFGTYFALSLTLLLLWRSALSLAVVNEPHSVEARKLGLRVAVIPFGSAVAAICAWFNTEFSFYAFLAVLLASRVYSRRRYGRLS
jgi:hypothetical protein